MSLPRRPSVTLFFAAQPLKMVCGRGQFLVDEEGHEYLDCINNVAHVGHANKRVADAVARQMSLLYTNSRFLHDNLSLYAKRLTSLFPAHLNVCYLVNSGSEANDLAIRLARAHTGHKDIVSLDGAYHGNSTSVMAISPFKLDKTASKGARRAKWAHVAPLPCAYRGEFSRDKLAERCAPDTMGQLYAAAAERVMQQAESEGRNIAAMFVESMVSCGGQTPLPAGYLRHLQRHLRARNALLVADEVQTGFGRSGEHMWAFQLGGDDVEPDIVTVGKPMGNGFPVSAVVTTRAVAESFKLNTGTEYFNTFGGNPASCAAALAVLDELEQRQLQAHARQLGAYLLDELRKIQANPRWRVVGDVRGVGFFIGVEIVDDIMTREPAPEHAQFIVQHFRDRRILISTEGKLGNVLKFKPPMVFERADARRFLDTLEEALDALQRMHTCAPTDSQTNPSSSSSSSTTTTTSSSASSSSSTSSAASTSSWLDDSSCEL